MLNSKSIGNKIETKNTREAREEDKNHYKSTGPFAFAKTNTKANTNVTLDNYKMPDFLTEIIANGNSK